MDKQSIIIVTGAAGFIGSCLVSFLNGEGFENLILVDDFKDEKKEANLNGKKYSFRVEREHLFEWLKTEKPTVEFVYHLGARTDTTEFDYAIHQHLNVDYSKTMWNYCSNNNISLVYASSAATYGSGESGYDDDHAIVEKLQPLNPYGVSKNEVDKWVLRQAQDNNRQAQDNNRQAQDNNRQAQDNNRQAQDNNRQAQDNNRQAQDNNRQAQVNNRQAQDNNPATNSKAPPFWAALKFFNVYGPNEYHKGRMASVIYHAYLQIVQNGYVKLFKSYQKKFADGEQLRDFIYVKDVVKICYWLMDSICLKDKIIESGIYNVGTGKARSFNELIKATYEALNVPRDIRYIDMPEDIKEKYQYFTQANTNKIVAAGYTSSLYSLEDGVDDYARNYLVTGKYY